MHPQEDGLGDILGLIRTTREHHGPTSHYRSQGTKEEIDFTPSANTGGARKVIQMSIGHSGIPKRRRVHTYSSAWITTPLPPMFTERTERPQTILGRLAT
jgi:hypothetical protein